MDVAQAERAGIWIFGRCIFTWVEEKIKAQEEHVRYGIRLGRGGHTAEVGSMGNDREGDGFHAVGRWVLFLVCL